MSLRQCDRFTECLASTVEQSKELCRLVEIDKSSNEQSRRVPAPLESDQLLSANERAGEVSMNRVIDDLGRKEIAARSGIEPSEASKCRIRSLEGRTVDLV